MEIRFIQNEDEKTLGFLMSTSLPIFIWGSGQLAYFINKRLNENNIHIRAYVIDDAYYNADCGDNIIRSSELSEIQDNFVLIKGYTECLLMTDEEIKKIFPYCVKCVQLSEVYSSLSGIQFIDKDYYYSNADKYEKIISSMHDEKSKESIIAFLNAKINHDRRYLFPYIEQPQYFCELTSRFIKENEIVFDCGAYDGDSLKDFIEFTGSQYLHYYASEPAPEMLEKLSRYISNNKIDNVTIVGIGISDRKKTMQVECDAESGVSYTGKADMIIQLDSIDNILQGNPVTLIKMDIEGAERDAIIGASKSIKKYHPILCISAYHRKDDIFTIFDTINSIHNEYRFFFRLHKYHTVDAVLYAIPSERV